MLPCRCDNSNNVLVNVDHCWCARVVGYSCAARINTSIAVDYPITSINTRYRVATIESYGVINAIHHLRYIRHLSHVRQYTAI